VSADGVHKFTETRRVMARRPAQGYFCSRPIDLIEMLLPVNLPAGPPGYSIN
jgi:hypothetical protein